MNFTEALDELIASALQDDGPSVEEVIFDLGQAELNLRLAILQADPDADTDAE